MAPQKKGAVLADSADKEKDGYCPELSQSGYGRGQRLNLQTEGVTLHYTLPISSTHSLISHSETST